MMQKYVHPNAYLPESLNGSTVLASICPGGLVGVVGILTRAASSWAVSDIRLMVFGVFRFRITISKRFRAAPF